jgi:hypothetical protein
MKIHPVGTKLFRVGRRMDGQADMLKLTVASHHFANMPKNAESMEENVVIRTS